MNENEEIISSLQSPKSAKQELMELYESRPHGSWINVPLEFLMIVAAIAITVLISSEKLPTNRRLVWLNMSLMLIFICGFLFDIVDNVLHPNSHLANLSSVLLVTTFIMDSIFLKEKISMFLLLRKFKKIETPDYAFRTLRLLTAILFAATIFINDRIRYSTWREVAKSSVVLIIIFVFQLLLISTSFLLFKFSTSQKARMLVRRQLDARYATLQVREWPECMLQIGISSLLKLILITACLIIRQLPIPYFMEHAFYFCSFATTVVTFFLVPKVKRRFLPSSTIKVPEQPNLGDLALVERNVMVDQQQNDVSRLLPTSSSPSTQHRSVSRAANPTSRAPYQSIFRFPEAQPLRVAALYRSDPGDLPRIEREVMVDQQQNDVPPSPPTSSSPPHSDRSVSREATPQASISTQSIPAAASLNLRKRSIRTDSDEPITNERKNSLRSRSSSRSSRQSCNSNKSKP